MLGCYQKGGKHQIHHQMQFLLLGCKSKLNRQGCRRWHQKAAREGTRSTSSPQRSQRLWVWWWSPDILSFSVQEKCPLFPVLNSLGKKRLQIWTEFAWAKAGLESSHKTSDVLLLSTFRCHSTKSNRFARVSSIIKVWLPTARALH